MNDHHDAELEGELLNMYERLRELSESEDTAPCVKANCKQAAAVLWTLCNDLALFDDANTTS